MLISYASRLISRVRPQPQQPPHHTGRAARALPRRTTLDRLWFFWRSARRRLARDRALRRGFYISGAMSGTGYTGLFLFSGEILRVATRSDGLFFLVPIAIALLFSLGHGAFTGYFWRVLGVRAKRAETRG